MMHNIKWIHAFFFLAIVVIVFNVFAASSFGINLPGNISRPHEDNPDQKDMVLIPAGEFIMGSSSEEVEPIIKEFGKRGDFIGYNFEREKPRRKYM